MRTFCHIIAIVLMFSGMGLARGECQPRQFSSAENAVIKSYFAYYGRVPDLGGLTWWAQQLVQQGGSLSAIMEAFGTSTEFTEIYGLLSSEDLVRGLYQQALGRSADTDGLNWYANELASQRMSLQTIALQLLDGAQNADVTTVDNKLLAAQYYVTVAESAGKELAAGDMRSVLASVTSDEASAAVACQDMSSALQSASVPLNFAWLDTALAQAGVDSAQLAVRKGAETWQFVRAGAGTVGGEPFTANATLRIASITKMLVGVLMVKLVEQGKVDLSETLSEGLPAEIMGHLPPAAAQITLMQLLSMQSGLEDYSHADGYAEAVEARAYGSAWTLSELTSYLQGTALRFSPGSDFHYSNTNYVLIQAILERKTGESLAGLLKKEIFEPVSMLHSRLERNENGLLSLPTTHGFEGTIEKTSENDALGFADGGVIATAADLQRLLHALFHEKTVLTESGLTLLSDVQREDYGLGLERVSTANGVSWGHNGASSGFQGEARYWPDHKLSVVLLTNQFEADAVGDWLDDIAAYVLQETASDSE